MMNTVKMYKGSLLSLQMTDKDENRDWGADSESDDKENNKKGEPRRKSARTQVSPDKRQDNTALDQLKKDNKKLQNNVQTLTKAKDSLTKERDNLKKERNDLKKKCDTLEKEKKNTDALQGNIDTLNTEKTDLQKQIDTLTTEKNDLTQQIKNLNDQTAVIKDLNDEMAAKDTEIGILNERLNEETEAKNELAQEAMKNNISNNGKEPTRDTRQRLLLMSDEKNTAMIISKIDKNNKYKWETLESVNTVENVKDLVSDNEEFVRKLSTYHGIVIMLGGCDIMTNELTPNTVSDYMKEIVDMILNKTKSFVIICETPPATGKLGMFTLYNMMLRSIVTSDSERISFFPTQQHYRMTPKRDSMEKDSPYFTSLGAEIWTKHIVSAINIPPDFDVVCYKSDDSDTTGIPTDENMHIVYEVKDDMMGHVVGKWGANIISMQDKTGADLSKTKWTGKDGDHSGVICRGSKSCVLHAISEIKDVIKKRSQYPPSQNEGVCKHFAEKGSCLKGDDCRFRHDNSAKKLKPN